MIQEWARFRKHRAEGIDEARSAAWRGLFENMSNGRKLFKLFRSFNEYVTIKGYLKGDAPLDNALAIASRLAFLGYWLFDNLTVLIKIRVIRAWDLKATTRRAAKFWLTGIVLTILLSLLGAARCSKEEAELRYRRAQSTTSAKAKQFEKELAQIRADRRTNILNAIKMAGDGITATHVLGYPARFLGVTFSDSLVAAGGFSAGFITCYQKYPW